MNSFSKFNEYKKHVECLFFKNLNSWPSHIYSDSMSQCNFGADGLKAFSVLIPNLSAVKRARDANTL